MLPSFLVIGAQKAGTSSLHRYLARQRDVHMSSPKELDFFVEERNWSRGLGWYEAHFDGAGDSRVRAAGESSPLYAMYPAFPGVPERIATTLPDVRLVYLVRDPIERLRSHYRHVVAEDGERRSLDAVARDDSGLIAFSLYGMQLERYLEHVPEDRILVLPAEWLREHRGRAVREVLAFVGADPGALDAEPVDEAHRSDEKRRPRRGLAPLSRAAGRLPGALRGPVERLATRPMTGVDTTIPPPLERELRRQFRADLPLVRRLVDRDLTGLPEPRPTFDAWGLD